MPDLYLVHARKFLFLLFYSALYCLGYVVFFLFSLCACVRACAYACSVLKVRPQLKAKRERARFYIMQCCIVLSFVFFFFFVCMRVCVHMPALF